VKLVEALEVMDATPLEQGYAPPLTAEENLEF
jgi:hypothetical protein